MHTQQRAHKRRCAIRGQAIDEVARQESQEKIGGKKDFKIKL